MAEQTEPTFQVGRKDEQNILIMTMPEGSQYVLLGTRKLAMVADFIENIARSFDVEMIFEKAVDVDALMQNGRMTDHPDSSMRGVYVLLADHDKVKHVADAKMRSLPPRRT